MGGSGWHGSIRLAEAVSKVRSLSLDVLEPTVLSLLHRLGNAAAARVFEATMEEAARPPASATLEEKAAFIRDKYIARSFVAEEDPARAPTSEALRDERLAALARAGDYEAALLAMARGADAGARERG